MRLRIGPTGIAALGGVVVAVEMIQFGCSGHTASDEGAAGATANADAGATGGKGSTDTSDGGCSLGVPDGVEGCIGADAGAEMVTSDGTPLLFSFAAPDPATGDWESDDGSVVAQIYSSPTAGWQANVLRAFDQPDASPVAVLEGTPTSCTSMTFSGGGWSATLQGGQLTAQNGSQTTTLKRVVRASPTLCEAPPAGAVVLFDGTSFDQWGAITTQNWLQTSGPSQWSLVDGGSGGAMQVVPGTASLVTKQSFGACTIHVEFRTLGTPTHSGVFPEARYQTTILQTYGFLTGNMTGDFGNESPVVNPSIHAERPPLVWQTLDIDFIPPGGPDGGPTSPTATVRLNGVTIFDSYELAPPTGAASSYGEAPTGPILLEYHGMPLQYRNIWVVPAGQ